MWLSSYLLERGVCDVVFENVSFFGGQGWMTPYSPPSFNLFEFLPPILRARAEPPKFCLS